MEIQSSLFWLKWLLIIKMIEDISWCDSYLNDLDAWKY
jgi:hypothetical protein